MPTTPVAVLEHRCDRSAFSGSRDRFIEWRKAFGHSPEKSGTFMVFRSERTPENPADYAADLCAELEQPLTDGDQVMKAGLIPGGRCAVLRYPGNTTDLEPAAMYLYRDWLPVSGEEARDFPMYSKRWLAPMQGSEAHDMVLELFLPLKS